MEISLITLLLAIGREIIYLGNHLSLSHSPILVDRFHDFLIHKALELF
jgi:hypothetical protein